MRRIFTRKVLITILAVGMGLVAAVLLVWTAVAGPVTVDRIIRFGDTDIDDFSHYPGRPLHPSQPPFAFNHSPAELRIPQDTLTEYGAQGDLESILESNDTIAFLVIADDTILYERYYQGHTASSISQLFSVSKSFTSALIGMAIEDGYFESVDQPITDYIPELADAGFSQVTLQHLLTMMSGSSYHENDNPFGEHVILNYTPHLEEEILAMQIEQQPGEIFRYKSGDNALLGLALARALHPETITEYAQRRLWSPLGMQDRGVWTIDHEGDGLEKTWCCLATSARDLAKFGRLYLHEGVWNGQQIISSAWVKRSTEQGYVPAAVWPDEYRSADWRNYGYQWWLSSEQEGDYFALGKDGQFLYLNPAAGIIIVRLGWSTGQLSGGQWVSLFQTIAQHSG